MPPTPTCRKLETKDVRMDIRADIVARSVGSVVQSATLTSWLELSCPHCLFSTHGGSPPFWRPQVEAWLADFVQRHNQEPRV